MLLTGQGDPALLKAMGVESVVLGCAPGVHGEELGTVVTPENLGVFAEEAEKARSCGLVCRCIYPDWNLVEKTIDDPDYMDVVMELLDGLSKHGLIDLFVSCGLRRLDMLSRAEREAYTERFIEHLGQIYEHAEQSGLHICLHSSLMPWIYLRDVPAWDRWLRCG